MKSRLIACAAGAAVLALTLSSAPAGDPPAKSEPPGLCTFSIVGYDPATEELGIAVQSKFVAVGAVVPWARAGVGAVATQSFANTQYGPEGLALLEAGKSPQEAIDLLTGKDGDKERRQVGIVDAKGRSATFTGARCMTWAGGVKGVNFCAQGNILASEKVVLAMAKAFTKTKGELGKRLITALAAGQDQGGDRRGKQSAALLIVRKGWGYGGFNDRYRDLRVDDHPKPIRRLMEVYRLHRKVFPQPYVASKKPDAPEPGKGGKRKSF